MLSFPAPSWQGSVVPKTRSLPRDPNARTASLIVPRLYLSDFFTAKDDKELSKFGITHVVSVIEQEPTLPDSILTHRRLHIPVADRSDVDILSHLEKTTAFIQFALLENDTNKVLVHCFQGISRSATVVCAYLVATTNMIAAETIAFCQAKRGIVCPNIGFRRQLDQYAKPFYEQRAKNIESKGTILKLTTTVTNHLRRLKRSSIQRRKEVKFIEEEDP